MGYLTRFSVKASGFKDEEEAEFFLFKLNRRTGNLIQADISNRSLSFETGQTKWYGCEKELTEVSTSFPAVTIDVEAEGEESGDIWKMRVRNGDSERVAAIVVFPDFKRLTD